MMGTLQRTREMYRESYVYGMHLRDREEAKDLMLILNLNVTMDLLAMVGSVHWYGYVLRMEDGHVLRRALEFEVEGQKKNGRTKRTWSKQVVEESMKVC